MGKKLLSILFIFSLFLLNSWNGFGQNCTDNPPSVTISTNSESTVCDDQTISFTGTVSPTDPNIAYVYHWEVSVNNGVWNNIPGATSKDLTNYNAAIGSNRFRLSVTYCNGDTEKEAIEQSPASAIITVYEKKEGSVSIKANKTAVCPGEEAVYSINSISNHGGSSAQYEWLLNGNSFPSPKTGNTLTYAPSVNDEISLKVDSGTPCVDDFISTNTITLGIKPGTPAQPGAISTPTLICPGEEENYSISGVTNATEYLWTLPNGSTQTTTQTNINLTINSSGNHELSVQAVNECGTSEKETTTVKVNEGIPDQPEFTTTHDNLCPDEIYTFSIAEIAGADEYHWTYGTTTVTTTIPSADISFSSSGNKTISVEAANECGNGISREITVTVNPDAPATPGSINGANEVCPATSETYSITAVADAEEYTWNFPTGWADGNPVTTTTPEVTVQTGSSGSGNISVIASNSCGNSTAQTFAVAVKDGTPVSAGSIDIVYANTDDVNCPGDQLEFSVSGPAEAEEFAWTVPTGWTISGATDGNSITVTAGDYGQNGNVTVKPINSCGTGPESSLAVNIDPPAPEMPGEISGPEAVCSSGTGLTYSVSAVADAETYNWIFPTGWTITGGQGTNLVTVSASTTSGDVSVSSENSCGESLAKIKNIEVTTGAPGVPGAITSNLSNNSICPPTTNDITFSIVPVNAANYYEWELPTGWEITNEPEGTSINVKVNANANYGDNEEIRVRGWNVCGPGNWSTLSGIAVDDYVLTNAGPDQEVCSIQAAINLDGSYSFAGSNRNLKPTWTTNGSGQFQNTESVSTTYTPSLNDISSGQVTLTLTTEAPKGACGPGQDQMTIYFRDDPTADISSEITTTCTGTSTDFTITGTPKTTVGYSIGGNNQTIQLGLGDGTTASTILSTGELTETTTITLVSSAYTDNTPGCSANLDSSIEIVVTQTPTATISYSGPYCTSLNESTGAATLQGENAYTGGVFTASGDLSTEIVSGDGSFIPAQVDPGTYTVTYTIPASGGCGEVAVNTEVTITALPTAEISYPDAPFCSSDDTGYSATLTGTGAYEGGTFSSTTGLNINAETGVINPSASTPGDYTITYTTPAGEGCGEVPVTTEITITEIPAPEISYTATELCTSHASTYDPTITGSGAVTGGTFSAPEGLSILSSGVITPGSSTPGTYIITYTLNSNGDGCDEVIATTEITITEQPAVEIIYNDGPFCESDAAKAAVTFINTAGAFDNGSFSAETGLTINETTGEITPDQSEPGSYTVSYTIPSSRGCNEVIATTTVAITEVPSVVISYNEVSFCSNDSTSFTVNYTDGVGNYENGNFTGTPGLEIDSATGAITPSASTTGVHKVTYSIPTAEGCEAVTTTTEITINEEIIINSQPFSLGVCSGENVEFEVSATGDDLTYQWYKSDDSEVAGATSAILEISPATSADDGGYYAIISGAASCSTVQSDEVFLTVDENITVETEPQDQDVCVGDEVTFNVAATATGGDVIYQWLKNGDEIAGENNSTLILPSVNTDNAGEYAVYIEGPDGYSCSTITTGAGVLTISPPPTAVAGESFSVCYSTSSFLITDEASAENFSSIIWEHDGNGEISNANSLTDATYTLGTDESGEVTLTLRAYGNSTCPEITSQKTVSIEPLPVITEFSYSASEFCETDTALKIPTLDGENAFEGGVFTVTPETGLSINSEGIIEPSTSTIGTYEIVYSTPDALCEPIESQSLTIVIGEEPTANFEYDAEVYCKDTRDPAQNTDPVLTATEDHAGAETFTANAAGLALNAATGSIDLSNSNAGTYVITRTIDYSGENEDGCTEVTANFEITINDKPIPDFTYEAQEFCSDPENPLTISPTLTTNAVLGSFSFTSTIEGASLSLNVETGEINITNSGEATFTVTNTVDYIDAEEDSCEPVSFDFTLTINKKSDANFAYTQQEYCITDEFAAVASENFESGGTFSSETLSAAQLDTQTGAISWNYTDEAIVGTHTIQYFIEGEGVCDDVSQTFNITIDPISEGGELNFASFDRIFTICENAGSNYAVPLQLSENIGAVVAWKYRSSSAPSWSTVMENGDVYTGNSLSADQIEAININETTIFRVEIYGGACSTNVFSDTAILSVIPSDIKPTPVEVNPEVVCIGEEVTLSSGTGYESSSEFTGGAFDNSSITNHGWRITDRNGSTEFNFNSSANNTRPDKWLRTNPQSFITADINSNAVSEQEWSSGAEGNKGFAIVSGDNPSTLETPVFNLGAMDQAILSFNQAYNLTEGAIIRVEISTNGGDSYDEEINPLYEKTGPLSSGSYGSFGTSVHPNNNISIDLGNFMGQSNLRIRFNYLGARDGDIWTIDDIGLPDAPRDVSMEWRDYTDPDNPEGVLIGYDASEVWEPKEIGWNNFEVKTRLIFNSEGDACEVAENAETISVFVFDKYTSEIVAETGSCGVYSTKLSAVVTSEAKGDITSYPTDDGYIGKWEVEGPEGYEFSNIDPEDTTDPLFNPDAIFTADDFGAYTLNWVLEPTETNENGELINNEGCEIIYESETVEFIGCIALDFDGIDDYVDLGETYNGNYSLEAWIRPEASTGTIISGPNFEINMENLPGGIIPNSRWYHIAVSNGMLYVDGIENGIFNLGNGGSKTLIGARWNDQIFSDENHFSGWIEEVRIWNGSISEEQIQFLMNQRLQDDANIGVEIPMPSPGSNYADLAGYYQLLADPDLVAEGTTPDLANTSTAGRLINMETFQENTAPLPYTSRIDGQNWGTDNTWTHFDVWDAPNSNGINDTPIDWNIVRTSHDINSGNKDIRVLGLKSETGTLDVFNPSGNHDETNPGQFLSISHYLLLNGVIDLTGESQLLQDVGSIVDTGSSGYLERDQQGTANSYNYNYWSFPVSTGTSNAGGTIRNLLRDGSNSNAPGDISFAYPHTHADNYDFNTGDKRISSYWLFKFFGTADVYAEWKWIGENGHLNTGDGFTMKGTSGAVPIITRQNYVFRGLPNNGPISGVSIGENQNRLIGNPYPSALDAKQFILDNLDKNVVSGATNTQNIFNGALYFWNHFGEENTHILREYVGGYATINLSGATAPATSSDERINNDGSKDDKRPGQFVPVGQGFFINTVVDSEIENIPPITGGNVEFNNAQRAFVTEANATDSYFLKPIYPSKKQKSVTTKDTRYKIRLNFNSPQGYMRQILVTADANTTNDFDLGYDAPLMDNLSEDMYWLIQKGKFVIQGAPHFNLDQNLPIGLKITEEKEFSIEIGELENVPDIIEIYLRDNTDSTYHDLRKEAFKATLPAGEYQDLYEIVFHDVTSIKKDKEPDEGPIDYYYSLESREFVISNPELHQIEHINIYNIAGQLVDQHFGIPDVKEIHIPQKKSLSSAVYIVKVYTSAGNYAKKVIIRKD
ncbi:T9SS type A sorting domain-containing protein [Salegentibacter sp. LM13S]|uniref:T9SS type A sorting domain-containing protein n=1 Tax=Salegentibacter lacus TaxID=2873599 RepID=UPI001CCB3951|nr:T9SS type A sorting domain-containing protein [Salegentibacter lacus]MBZ9632032.1 T9SS type A sorting domain-containing protein [Salegentibacter lacus]